MSFTKSFFQHPAWRRHLFGTRSYPKYGMLRDDVLYETPVVKEAIRRLPQSVQDIRIYRIQRAQQLSLTRTILPKDQWTKFEDDVYYMQPYIDEVEAEIKEKEEWAANHC